MNLKLKYSHLSSLELEKGDDTYAFEVVRKFCLEEKKSF